MAQQSREELPSVSVVVACKSIDPYVKECIFESLQLDYPSFELIVLPDQAENLNIDRVKEIPTGHISPSDKRNLGVESAKGELIAFIDGDAYPAREWLRNGVKYFDDEDVAAVGGPGLTPSSDDLTQQASGEILSSFLGAGPLSFRHSAKLARRSDDLPTVNLIVRRSSFERVRGFDTSYWPGEDTKFSRDIVFGLEMRALYAPDVRVFHHRRHIFREHLEQVAGYGLHRGYFSKKFPENSRRPLYFLPSGLVIGSPVLLTIAYFNSSLAFFSTLPIILYAVAVGLAASLIGLRHRSFKLSLLVFSGVIATHVWYGIYFLKGLLSKKIGPNPTSYKSNIRCT